MSGIRKGTVRRCLSLTIGQLQHYERAEYFQVTVGGEGHVPGYKMNGS